MNKQQQLKRQTKLLFKQNKFIICPVFPKEKVYFNSKVIVRQVGNGKKHFWSVIPAWRKIDGEVINAKNDFWKD